MSTSLQSRDGEDTQQQLLKLLSSPFQSAFTEDAFWASLGTSLGFSLFLTLIFSLLRPRHTLVYAPKTKHADSKHAPPPVGRGPLAWFKPTLAAKENDLVEKIGMDAVFFLRFTRMLRNIFCILAVVGILVMIPVNVALGNKQARGDSNAFAVMTPLFVWGQGIWAQVIVAYVVDITMVYFLWANYRQFHRLRRQYYASPDFQNSVHARSLIISDIPPKARSVEGILRLTDEVNPSGVLPFPNIGRNVKILPDLIEEHEETVRQLESVLAKYLKNPNRLPVNRPTMKAPKEYKGTTSGGKVDSISYLTERIRALEVQIEDVRERVDKRDAVGYGFATWEQISQAHAVAYNARRKSPQGAKIRLAPRPNEIIWKNLTLPKGTRTRKRWFNAVWITVLTALWTPLNAGIAIFLSNLSNLGSVWPRFQQSLIKHRTWWAIVQGIASPAIISLVYLVLPIIFRRMQIRAGDVTKTSRERHVLRNLYNFFTFNNLVVFSLFAAIWQYISTVINSTQNHVDVWDAIKQADLLLTITISLCQISPFWVTWILQRNLGATVDLAQLWSLFYVWFARTFLAPTPRQNIEWTAPPAFDYASYYNYFLFYSTIALCFSTLQPIILVVTALYFLVDSVLKKYLLMYVFVTKTESGGQFWRPLFNRLVFATILANIFIAVVVGARGTWTMVYAMVPLLFLMIGFKIYCARTFDADMHYYHRTGMQQTDAEMAVETAPNTKMLNRASQKFRHPALDQRLITPMVHAKARHVLSQIYSGRLSDAGAVPEYSDIALEPMTQSGKPPQDSPFELVPETQQDFAYYKNRSDFREEGGEIYGRPEDIIPSRSNTPASFLTSSTMAPGKAYKDAAPSDQKEILFSDDSPITPGPQKVSPIPRRAVNTANIHPNVRNSMGFAGTNTTDQEGDLSLRHGLYTDPNDDTANLLHGVGDIRTPNGEFMTADRWQAQGSADGSRSTTPGFTGGSYDYFRSQNHGYRGV